MNETHIENLLRKTPRLKTPDGLREKLREDIRLPREPLAQNPAFWFLLKRWLPLSFCLILGMTAIAFQFHTLSRLSRENRALQAATQNIETLRRDNREYQKLRLAAEDLTRFQKDNAELLRLRAEAAQLRTETADLEKLREENKSLAVSIAASSPATNDFFAEAQARAERIQCINNLKQVGLSARIWAGDNNDIAPSNFITMTNEMGTPKILKCPSDKSRGEITWAEVAAGNISYKMDLPGFKFTETPPNLVYVECPIHHAYCLVDGSVQAPDEKQAKLWIKTVNGKKVFNSTP